MKFDRRMGVKTALAAALWLMSMGTAQAKAAAEVWDTLYHSQYAVWVTPHYNAGECAKYKKNLDSIEAQLDISIPFIKTNLGIGPKQLPQRVEIDSSTGGMGGWAAGETVGYQISDFYGAPKISDGLRWIRGVIIGEVINATTGTVTDNWPTDWWVDHVWYFPGFIAGEILKVAVSPAFSEYWLTSEHYPTYPVYNIFTGMLKEKDWTFYKDFFAGVAADKMKWGQIGDNPSKIKTDYVIAYLSLAAGRNMGGEFNRAKVSAADSVEVAAIIGVQKALHVADDRNLATTSAWSSFRKGDYAAARTALQALGVSSLRAPVLARSALSGIPLRSAAYSLDGRLMPANGSVYGSLGSHRAAEYYIYRAK